jgi:hypothetical protein
MFPMQVLPARERGAVRRGSISRERTCSTRHRPGISNLTTPSLFLYTMPVIHLIAHDTFSSLGPAYPVSLCLRFIQKADLQPRLRPSEATSVQVTQMHTGNRSITLYRRPKKLNMGTMSYLAVTDIPHHSAAHRQAQEKTLSSI